MEGFTCRGSSAECAAAGLRVFCRVLMDGSVASLWKYNEPLGHSRPVIIKAEISASSPDTDHSCSTRLCLCFYIPANLVGDSL